MLHREPGCAKLIPTDILLHCLQNHSSLELAALLVQNCSTHCLTFELWCLEQTDLAHITAQNSSFLSLLNSYLQQVTTEDPSRPKDSQYYHLLSDKLTEQRLLFIFNWFGSYINIRRLIFKKLIVKTHWFLKLWINHECKALQGDHCTLLLQSIDHFCLAVTLVCLHAI